MNEYELLKSLHVACAFVSICLFVYRFALLYRKPSIALGRTLKVLPHFVDTILLSAALGMLWILRLNPFEANWLVAKFFALLAYVVFGALCLRSAPGSRRQLLFFARAFASVSYIVFVAFSKMPIPYEMATN